MKSFLRALGGLLPYRTSTKPAQSEEINVQNEVTAETSTHRIYQVSGERPNGKDAAEPEGSYPPNHDQKDDDEDKADVILPYIRTNQSGLTSILATNSPTHSAKSLDDSVHFRRSIQFTVDATAEKPSSKQNSPRHKNEEGALVKGTGSKRSSLIIISPTRSPKTSALNLSSIQPETDDTNQETESALFGVPFSNWDRSDRLSGPLPDLTDQVKQLNPFAESEGSHSSVFIGRLSGKKVAIKVFRGMRFTSETSEKVKVEREIWWQLDHENVLPVLGFSEQFGRYGALIYPWCEGGNTGNYLRKPGNASERFQLWYGVVKAICYLHSHDPQVVHGDLKPTNVLISGGKAKVCDFGLLKLLAEETMGMTTTSAHIGTMRYLARELVVADDQPDTTSHTDVHALGCLGLEFLFLRIPYAERRNPAQIFKDIADSVPPSRILPVAGEPAMPIKQLWDKLNECWDPDPAKRPTARQLQDFVEANEAVIMRALENDFVPAPGLLE